METKLFKTNSEIISVFHFTCIHVWNRNKIISATERVLKLFQNYFTISATLNMLENIHERQREIYLHKLAARKGCKPIHTGHQSTIYIIGLHEKATHYNILQKSVRVAYKLRQRRHLSAAICPCNFFQITVGSGSPVARQWNITFEFSLATMSLGLSTIRGFTATSTNAKYRRSSSASHERYCLYTALSSVSIRSLQHICQKRFKKCFTFLLPNVTS